MVKRIFCLSESGWRGIRQLSLMLNELGIHTDVWINDWPSDEVRAVIQIHPYIRNYFLPRKVTRAVVYFLVIWTLVFRKALALVVVKRRTLRALSLLAGFFSVPVFFLEEIQRDFRIYQDGKLIENPKMFFTRFRK